MGWSRAQPTASAFPPTAVELPALRTALSDFVVEPSSGVLVSPDRPLQTTTYLDGAEQHLLEVIAQSLDRSVYSQELRDLIRDWPTLYHLTPYRSTILDCLGFSQRETRVLELGAGCGAITRWLGERFSDVHAVEGSFARARVAKARCEDLESVRVYSSNFYGADFGQDFDLATLIGVLEYSHIYHPNYRNRPKDAAVATLRVAHDALNDEGLLVVAIENKLGLKYWSGSREDHSGKVFDGIQGYASTETAVTWNAKELREILTEAGFPEADFYLPFPDYKLARSIVNPAVAGEGDFVHNWVEVPFPDRVRSDRTTLFNEALVLRELCKAGLLDELGNSFVVLAYKGPSERARARRARRIDDSWAARAYSLDRHPAYAKRTTLSVTSTGERRVAVDAVVAGAPDAGSLEQTFQDENFQPGDSLIFTVFEAAAAGRLAIVMPELVQSLKTFLVDEYGTGREDGDGVPLLRGDALDAAIWNLIVDAETGAWHAIDREWRFPDPLPADFVIWRGLVHLVRKYPEILAAELGSKALMKKATEWTAAAFPSVRRRGRRSAFEQLLVYIQYAAGALPPRERRRLEDEWGGPAPAARRALTAPGGLAEIRRK